VALVAAGVGFVLMSVAFATGNHPVWAALAMAAVALLTSLAAAAGPLGGLLGFLVSLAYFLIATMARVANLFDLVSVPWAVAHIALGCLGGLLVVFVGTARRRRHEPDEVKAARAPVPIRPMWESLRRFDEQARDGVRRAIPLAILMHLFQREGGRDAFWIFFAAYIVLLSTGKAPKDLAAVRVGSTLFGVVALAVASLVVPDKVLFSLGVVILFVGIGLSPAIPDRRRRAYLDRVDSVRGSADRGRDGLGGGQAARHDSGMRDRDRRDLPALAERQGDARASSGGGDLGARLVSG
jgi:MFS family permease